MNIKNLTICLIAMFSTAFALHSQTSEIEIFTQELNHHNASLKTIQSQFIQKRAMSVLQNTVEIKGHFYYSVPNAMLLDFDNGDYIKMTESHFEIKNGDKVSSTKITANPMLRQLSSVLNSCVSGNIQSMIIGYNTSIKKSDKSWTLTMQPSTSKKTQSAQIIIEFDRNDMSISKLKIVESNGDYIMYHFFNKKINEAINPEIFAR